MDPNNWPTVEDGIRLWRPGERLAAEDQATLESLRREMIEELELRLSEIITSAPSNVRGGQIYAERVIPAVDEVKRRYKEITKARVGDADVRDAAHFVRHEIGNYASNLFNQLWDASHPAKPARRGWFSR